MSFFLWRFSLFPVSHGTGTVGLSGHLCASAVEQLLYSPTLSGHFISLKGTPLPGSAGALAYVTPIWQAASGLHVSLTVVNAADETWQIIGSYPEDPVLDPHQATEAQVRWGRLLPLQGPLLSAHRKMCSM